MKAEELHLHNYLGIDTRSYQTEEVYQRFWEVDGPDWVTRSNNYPIPYGLAEIQLAKIERERHPVETVVDFGCSFGRAWEIFKDKTYIGLDIVESSLQRHRDAHPGVDVRKIPPKPDGWEFPECDVAWLFTVFVHIIPQDIEAYIAKIKAACKTLMFCETDQRRMGHANPFPNAYCYNHNYHELVKPYQVIELTGRNESHMSMYLADGDRPS